MEVMLYTFCLLLGVGYGSTRALNNMAAELRLYSFKRLHDPCIDDVFNIKKYRNKDR
jgi:hypothetical protein